MIRQDIRIMTATKQKFGNIFIMENNNINNE